MADDKAPVDDETLLGILREERVRSIGFDNDNGDLRADRQKALQYFKGQMDDVPSMEGRSSAVTTDVADAIRTLLPDLLDIFFGGDDPLTFEPTGPEDEKAAKQETAYLRKVIFQDNDGFHTIATMIQDALQLKSGQCTFYWEEYDPEEEVLEGKTLEEWQAIQLQANPPPPQLAPGQPPQKPPAPAFEIISEVEGEEPNTFDITIKKPKTGKVCIKPIAPEDFTAAQDTIRLPDSTYCAYRARPRRQELIAQGFDPDIVEQLPPYGTPRDDTSNLARDTAGEFASGATADAANKEMMQVETCTHFVKLLNGKTLETWRVVTGGGETKLLDKEKVQRVNMALITPYMVTHRIYGESVADLLMPIQRIATAVQRGYLDSIYFALNQRHEISEQGSSENTIADYLRNVPGNPVRSKSGDAIRPITTAPPNVNLLEAMEYFKTVAEQRTGVVRAAQGLNPDTLHETASGALALIGSALRRMRLIARVFAETGVKDLYLGVHALIREHSSQAEQMRFSGGWVPVDPSNWGERNDMTIEIGLGSAGKDQDIAMLMQQAAWFEKIVASQGGMQGPVITAQNVAALSKKFFEVTGSKTPEEFVSDPSTAPAQPPPPDPNAAKAQADMARTQQEGQIAMARLQAERDAKQQQFQLEQQKQAMTAQAEDHAQQLAWAKLQADNSIAQQDFYLKQSLALSTMNAQYQTSVTVAQIKAQAEQFRAHVDLALQASEHDHQQSMQAAEHDAQAAIAAQQPEPAGGQ